MATKVLTKESCGIASLDIRKPSDKQAERMKHVVANVVLHFALEGTHTEIIKQDGKDVAVEVPNTFTVRGIKITQSTRENDFGKISVIMPNFSRLKKTGDDEAPEGAVTEQQGGKDYDVFYPTDRLNAEQEAYVIDQYNKLAAIWEQQKNIPDTVTINIGPATAEAHTEAEPVPAQ